MRVLLWSGYYIWYNTHTPEERLFREQWNGSKWWWHMTVGIADSSAVIRYNVIAISMSLRCHPCTQL